MEQKCSLCQRLLPAHLFPLRKRDNYGRQSYCTDCTKAYYKVRTHSEQLYYCRKCKGRKLKEYFSNYKDVEGTLFLLCDLCFPLYHTCEKCQRIKLKDEFYVSRAEESGLYPRCKVCCALREPSVRSGKAEFNHYRKYFESMAMID